MKKKMIGFAVLTLTILLFITTAYTGFAEPTPPDPYAREGIPAAPFVMRVYYQEIADLDELAGYDVWEFNDLDHKYVLVSGNGKIFDELIDAGWRVEIDELASSQINPENFLNPFNNGYMTVDEIFAELAAIDAANPAIAELVDYGDSFCKLQSGCTTLGGDNLPGHDLHAMRITNESIAGEKPVFFLIANIHAREITTPELAMRLIREFVDNYGTDPDITWMVDYHEIWIVPTANPDGHWLVELGEQPPYNGGPFYQRKSGNSAGCSVWPPQSFSQSGVDLNRNHSWEWGPPGSSSSPCSQTYRGTAPASEPEVESLQALVASVIPDQRGPGSGDPAPDDTMGLFITIHSYSELVLWPWGHTTSPAPNKAGLEAIGDKLATYNGYLSCQPSLCLYGVNGSTDDWTYGELGVPSFTYEVGNQFMPPYSQVDNIQWPENGPSFLYAARIARAPYMLVEGPDALNLRTRVRNGKTYVLGTLDETDTGGQNVVGGFYSIDTPPWEPGARLRPLRSRDGVFNSSVELGFGRIKTDRLAPGRHTIYVYGVDSLGNEGPVSAVFFNVAP